MVTMDSRYGDVKIYAETFEQESLAQVIAIANSPLGENAHIRMMPDMHAGAGCAIGTTMVINDKVCPNLVGVDIGCGVCLVKTDIDFSKDLPRLDSVIRSRIPFGRNIHEEIDQIHDDAFFSQLKCWKNLDAETRSKAIRSCGTLGGGNHFIESYGEGYLSVHTGSRNIGLETAKFYQKQADLQMKERAKEMMLAELQKIDPKDRSEYVASKKGWKPVKTELAFLSGERMKDYIHDVKILQQFAQESRQRILNVIVAEMGGRIVETIESVHNYIDTESMILRKGAIRAEKDEILVIPMNMRDGLLICRGRGNEDWNRSAPHGAGRLYSRCRAKEELDLDEFKKTMSGIYSTCISRDTIDESPMAYKDCHEIMTAISPTVDIIKRLIPIYNFKAAE